MTQPVLHFWYEFASTYSYPAAMTLQSRADALGVKIVWRPFLLGPVAFEVQGWTDSIFNTVPVKGRYMWRDMERLCQDAELAFRKPSAFPRNPMLAARIAFWGQEQDWIGRYSRTVYEANFAKDRDISDKAVLSPLLTDLGLDAEHVITQAMSVENKERLKKRTRDALDLGLFGAPSFIADPGGTNELFWGYDRMDAALAWANGIRF